MQDTGIPPTPVVRMLPGCDEYFIGYHDRSAIIDDEYAKRVTPGKNGVFKPILLIDGRVEGVWSRTLSARGVEI